MGNGHVHSFWQVLRGTAETGIAPPEIEKRALQKICFEAPDLETYIP